MNWNKFKQLVKEALKMKKGVNKFTNLNAIE